MRALRHDHRGTEPAGRPPVSGFLQHAGVWGQRGPAMTTHHFSDPRLAGFGRDSGASPSLPAAPPSSRAAGPDRYARTDVKMEQEPHLDPQLGPDLTEILIRLRRIRTDISAHTPPDNRPVEDRIVQDLDEVIQRARLLLFDIVKRKERRPVPELCEGSVHEAVHLPCGPDYPGPMYR